MTNHQKAKLAAHLDSHIVEHFDGVAIIGFIAGSNEMFCFCRVADPKTALALNTLVRNTMIIPPGQETDPDQCPQPPSHE